jgi:Ca2+-binding RTX toxin-like protein
MISGVATVDAGAQEPLAQDVLDLSQYDAKVSVTGATIGVNGTSFNNFEKLILSSSANTVKVTSLSSVGGLQEIDAGANPPGSADVMDFSSSSPGINFSNSSVSQGNATLKLTNFEDLIGSSSNDTIDLSNSSIQFVNGSAGDDTMTAGSGGSTLDGSTGNNVYIGGDGIDTFVIGNGEYAQQGTNATFEIQNASASDRLVLRLDDTAGFGNSSNWTKGVVLNGGIYLPGDPIDASFDSTVYIPTGIVSSGDFSRVTQLSRQDVRTELGNYSIDYEWDSSVLNIKIETSYGNFWVKVDNFQDGDLGL